MSSPVALLIVRFENGSRARNLSYLTIYICVSVGDDRMQRIERIKNDIAIYIFHIIDKNWHFNFRLTLTNDPEGEIYKVIKLYHDDF